MTAVLPTESATELPGGLPTALPTGLPAGLPSEMLPTAGRTVIAERLLPLPSEVATGRLPRLPR